VGAVVVHQNSKIGKRPMNSSVLFVFDSMWQTGKKWLLRVFRNGKIQIPGVTRELQQSELPFLFEKVRVWFSVRARVDVYLTTVGQIHVVMLNYKAEIQTPTGRKFSVAKMISEFTAHAADFHTAMFQLVSISEIRNRPVLHLKFKIEKQFYAFYTKNASSAANKRKVKTITV